MQKLENENWLKTETLLPGGCSAAVTRDQINSTFFEDPDDPQRCPNTHKWVELLQGLYMLIANVLLLNLLIALFSNTFEQIQANAEKYWKFQRYSLIREYYYSQSLKSSVSEHFF